MDVDQGLRYELACAVAATTVIDPLTAVHPAVRTVALAVPGLALLPVTAEVAGAVTPAMICTMLPGPIDGGPAATGRRGAGMLTGPESGFTRLTPGLLALFEAASAAGPLAYLEADYSGRDGRQAAAVWRAGGLVLGPLLLGPREPFDPETAPISLALAEVGVAGRGRRDAFLVAGLDRCRATEDWT